MKWMIVTDSSCDLKTLEGQNEDLGFETVPFVMDVDGREFVDEPDLHVTELGDAMEKADKSHSACPSPETWRKHFEKADRVIAFTISGRLSGSYNSAVAGKNMVLEEYPGKQIEVIDSLSTGPKLVMLAQNAARQIQEELDARVQPVRSREPVPGRELRAPQDGVGPQEGGDRRPDGVRKARHVRHRVGSAPADAPGPAAADADVPGRRTG